MVEIIINWHTSTLHGNNSYSNESFLTPTPDILDAQIRLVPSASPSQEHAYTAHYVKRLRIGHEDILTHSRERPANDTLHYLGNLKIETSRDSLLVRSAGLKESFHIVTD